MAGAAAVFATLPPLTSGSRNGGSDEAFPFGNVENLTGTAQADTFTFTGVNGPSTGTASGLGGNDAFTVVKTTAPARRRYRRRRLGAGDD